VTRGDWVALAVVAVFVVTFAVVWVTMKRNGR
jgi:hypothetical protein